MYYQKSFLEDIAPVSAAGVNGAVGALCSSDGKLNHYFRHFVPMRNSSYTLDFYNPYVAGTGARNETDGTDTALSFANRSPHGFYVTTATVAGNANDPMKFHYTADNELY
jgi:hypothetical protein